MKLDELSRLLRAADPAAVLVPPDVMTRVIRNVSGTPWAVWRVPHAHCFPLDRYTLFGNVEQEELFLPPDHLLPETVLLLERPTADQLAGRPDDLLERYWRLLFHVTLHRELAGRVAGADEAGVRERVAAVGPAAFEEARNVLTDDNLLPPGADDRAALVELAATFLELRFFAPNLLPVYFPSLPPVADVEAVFARDVDAAAVFARTRLGGAPDPAPKTDDQADESHDFYWRLTQAARRAAKHKDTVGAAILHTRAARVAPPILAGPAQDAAGRDLDGLVARMTAALGLSPAEAVAWRQVLPALLDKADQGSRPVEEALLADLQRACRDHEQTTYALDLLEWLLSAGHRPIKRPLDGQRFVRVPAHLRAATRRLTAARLTDADRQAAAGLLRAALDRGEDRLRQRFRPVLTDALRDAGLRPGSVPEQAALAKTVEELLDKISAGGFFGFGDLRDAIARGQLKLPDLSGPQEYLRGDPLLRLDRRLATLLDGVYRRGEFYSRTLERLTAFSFGTDYGRWATLNVALPFGGAFLVAQFVWLLVFEQQGPAAVAAESLGAVASALVGGAVAAADGLAGVVEPPKATFFGGWNSRWWFHAAWLAVGAGLLGLVRSPPARAALGAAAGAAWRAARVVFGEIPRRVWANPVVRSILTSGPVRLGLNYLAKPLAVSGLVWLAFPDVWAAGAAVRGLTVLAAGLLVNSRLGGAVEGLAVQGVAGVLSTLRVLPAVVRWVNDQFRRLVDALEWVLARGEDWLRLRGDGDAVSVAARAGAGLLWAPFAFLLRFYMVVLVEPMFNPLKLPLSILFAKFVYPILAVLGLFSLHPLGSPLVGEIADPGGARFAVAWVLVVGTFYLLPDAVTFLFWETRENWRLYRANRPTNLAPVAVGPHGETVGGLLHPGFHSGTVPKLFSRLRAAELGAAGSGVWRDARAYRQALRGVEEAVGRFLDRDLAAILNPSPSWAAHPLTVGRVHLGTNRIRIELRVEAAARPAVLEWEDRSGWLVAGWADRGWVPDLAPAAARALTDALAYLYKRAGVDLVREQIAAVLPPAAAHFDVVADGLLVWYGSRDGPPVLYDLAHRADDLRPRTPDNLHPTFGPALDADRLIFGRVRLSWPEWLAVWQADADGYPPPRFGPVDVRLELLPPAAAGRPPALAAGMAPDRLSPPSETADLPTAVGTEQVGKTPIG